MTIGLRILIALPVAAFVTAALVFNLGAFAGGTTVLSVVEPSRLTFAYWFSGIGCFLTTTIVMVWLQRPLRADNDTSWRARPSTTWITRAIAAALLATVTWSIPGALYVKSGVQTLGVSGDPQAIEEAIETAAALHEKRYALYPQLGEDTLLFVRTDCADAVIAELQAAGLSVHEPPSPYEKED